MLLRRDVTQIFKFSLVGVVNTAIDVSLFAVLVQILGWDLLPANVLSYSCGVINSFILNKFLTFRDRMPLSKSLQPFAHFALINVSGLVLSTVVVAVLAMYMSPIIAKLCSVFFLFTWNYTLTCLLVFQGNGDD